MTFAAATNARAQVVISAGDVLFARTSFTVKLEVRDSVTNEPIAFASAYLHHPKDTIITNFALTDTLGKAELKDVAKGDHVLCVEFLGYKPYYKAVYLRKDFDAKVIRLQPDAEMLKAASVSAVGKPMEIKQDTVIYNASSFKTLSSDNLAALIAKMPGFEVGADGSVKHNGKAVSQITVGGKTFFLGDNKTTLDNLPAKIVDKVKVIDKESESAQFTGIKGEKEKVMDVELKEEYKKGWFGNVKLGAGTSIPGKDDNEFIANKDFLYSGSAMLSAYGEKNQVTALANSYNYVESGSSVIFISGEEASYNPSLGSGGIMRNSMVGVNVNSDAIKGFGSNVSATYSSGHKDDRSRTDRTTFQEGEDDLLDNSETVSDAGLDKLSLKFDFRKKDTKKTTFYFRPNLTFSDYSTSSRGDSRSAIGDALRNTSSTLSSSRMKSLSTAGYMNFGVKKLGKDRRAVTLDMNYELGGQSGDATEVSSTWYSTTGETSLRDLIYDNGGHTGRIALGATYVEPFGENWALALYANGSYTSTSNTKDASNADGSVNEYYSSESDNRYVSGSGRMLAQYNKGQTNLQFGGEVRSVLNENRARSFGIDTRTGVGEWQTSLSPFVNLSIMNMSKKTRYMVRASSNNSRPSAASIVPSFNIVNPTRITAGNIYLKPVNTQNFTLGYSGNIGKASGYFSFSPSIASHSQVSAVWYDENSIRYSVPVNSRKPTLNCNLYGSGDVPLTKDRKLSLSYFFYGTMSRMTSYQAKGSLPGIDIDSFDYSAFMEDFWGNAKGDRFYSGQSGFQESTTRQFSSNVDLRMTLRLEDLTLEGGYTVSHGTSKYSLDPRADTDTWINTFFLSPTYTTRHEFEFNTTLAYNTRSGYGSGYNLSYWNWRAKVGKNFKSFALNLIADDILDSRKTFNHSVQEDYIQDSYALRFGRTVMLSLTYNFGKMNAARSRSAQNASIMMSF